MYASIHAYFFGKGTCYMCLQNGFVRQHCLHLIGLPRETSERLQGSQQHDARQLSSIKHYSSWC